MRIRLTKEAKKLIDRALDAMFDRMKARMLGPGAEKMYGKQLVFRYDPLKSLSGLFEAASDFVGVKYNEQVLSTLLGIAGSYLDATRESAKAKVTHQVQSFLNEAEKKGEKVDVETVLGGHLAQIHGQVYDSVKRIVETEATQARNVSIHDGISRIAAASGIEDPSVFFVVVRDDSLCDRCKEMHLLKDGVTPRVWKMSEVKGSYAKKGDSVPSVGGQHPHCRCVLTSIMPGFGFNASGMITWKKPGWDELKNQRGED